VKGQLVICHYCGRDAEFVNSELVYGRDLGMIYLCQPCNAWVGVHRGTDKPKGTLANKELRDWRKMAHAAFDPLWMRKLEIRRRQRGQDYKKVYARGSGYKWLREQMGLPKSNCHIGMFDVEQCKQVVEICRNWRERRGTRTQGELGSERGEQSTEDIRGELRRLNSGEEARLQVISGHDNIRARGSDCGTELGA